MKMSFNSFNLKWHEELKQARKRVITKHDVYVPKRYANKHKTKHLIGHGSRLIANGNSSILSIVIVSQCNSNTVLM